MSVLLGLAIQAVTQIPPFRTKFDQARLDAMSEACRAPRSWLELRGREVVFRGDPDADFAKIECVLGKVSATIAATDLVIVGHAQSSEDR